MTNNSKKLTIGFIGLGLIGGSIAKGIRKYFPDTTIIAYNRSEQARISALSEGVADFVTDKVDSRFSDCDYIFLCTPVEHNIEYLSKLREIISPDTIITDVGSVKGNIYSAICDLDMKKNFIGGHPMAGSEKTGYNNSSETILENAYFALTPTEESPKERVKELSEIVAAIGSIPVILNAEEHDYAVAAISHVPHLIAASLVNLVKDKDSEKETMKLLAAGGFKDITRIASSSPEMWQQICSTNRKNIAALIDDYIDSLKKIKAAVSENDSDYIYKTFETSRDYRNSFSNGHSGPIIPVYKIFCDIVDKSGAILAVTSILAEASISIKNIGIVNNREHENGVLKIVFYDKESSVNARELLEKNGYTTYLN